MGALIPRNTEAASSDLLGGARKWNECHAVFTRVSISNSVDAQTPDIGGRQFQFLIPRSNADIQTVP